MEHEGNPNEECKMFYMNTQSSKDGNPEVLTSFIVGSNFRDNSNNDPVY